MTIYGSAVVLVGVCSSNPLVQIYFGTFALSIQDTNPVLINIFTDRVEKSTVDFYHSQRHGDSYTFEKYLDGHGLSIIKDENGQWKFSTGLHGYSSGSSGILVHGGIEMEELYNRYLTKLKSKVE